MSAAIGDPIRDDAEIVISADILGSKIVVVVLQPLNPKSKLVFDVYSNNQLRHIGLDYEGVGRALSHYATGLLYNHAKARGERA